MADLKHNNRPGQWTDNALLYWILNSLLTDSQLDVKSPFSDKTLRQIVPSTRDERIQELLEANNRYLEDARKALKEAERLREILDEG